MRHPDIQVSRYGVPHGRAGRYLGRTADADVYKRQTIAWYRDNEAWWRPAKEATEARYAAQGQ